MNVAPYSADSHESCDTYDLRQLTPSMNTDAHWYSDRGISALSSSSDSAFLAHAMISLMHLHRSPLLWGMGYTLLPCSALENQGVWSIVAGMRELRHGCHPCQS